MDLSVIIVNYNVRQFLENALTSVAKAGEGIAMETFVVDNASDDGSVEMVCAKFPGVHLIVNSANAGFAKANNLALRQATGDHILLINPDTIVQEDTFRVMLSFFRDHPDAGLAGCKILNPDGTLQLPCRRSFPTPWVAFTKIFGLSTMFPGSPLFGKYNLTYLDPEKTYRVDAVSGSFMMISRRAFEQVGGLDETFFMYGEDLDWCYRVLQQGFGVYYVHETTIVHFKGESTRRSEIDEIRVFYQAMQVFVAKHFGASGIVRAFLSLGIALRAAIAFAGRAGRGILLGLIDAIIVTGALMLSEFLYFGHLFRFPSYAYPIVWTVPALIMLLCGVFLGSYGRYRFSVSRAAAAVIFSYTAISASVFFAKNFAFSRAVVLIAGAITLILVPGWRFGLRMMGTVSREGTRRSLFGRKTVIVGTGPSAIEILKKLRARVDDGYNVLGFIGVNRMKVGDTIAGLEVLGSIDNVGKVLEENGIGEVIFSTDGLSYSEILSVIARSHSKGVNFRLVPNSLEAIIGKTRIDTLDTLPLLEIEYNIHKAGNIVAKRLFDLFISLILCVTVFPVVFTWKRLRNVGASGPTVNAILAMPRVFSGTLSLVGRPVGTEFGAFPGYLGPRGLTGLLQISQRDDLDREEAEKYLLYYAKNQSLTLDIEIIVKTLLIPSGSRKGTNTHH